ncbi:MAG: IS91 family transposase [Gemmatimonadales bacterium]
MDAVATSRTAACRPSGAGPVGVYRPRRAQASPLFRLVQDHFRTLQTVYDERFAPTYGAWRAVVPEVADKFLACGVLEHGFARVRCDACAHEYLLAFSCKARYFCPSCHAKRLALWTLWLEETLLAPVPHRQVVLTIPKRLRTWCLYRRALLGDLARVAAKTVTAAVRTLTCEPDLVVGVVACIQTHGSLANWHPHIHMLVTDGGFRADGTFVPWPAHDTAALTEAFRRAVLRLFVRRGIFEAEDAEGMLAWPHSGFHVHDGVWVADGDLEFAKRLARYCARNPVALDRLQYDGPAAPVQYRSDKRDGPTAGTKAVDPLEFLAPLVTHIPNKHQVMTRYYGWYANRPRGTRRQAATETATAPIEIAEREALPLREARRRWAELLRRIYEVDPLTCPACGGAMRILAFITEGAVVDQILAHLRRTRGDARGPPSTHRPARRDMRPVPTPV